MSNTPGVEKTIIIVFVVDACRLTFFDRHSALCLLV
jgi:hypothetical protein